MTYQSTIQLSIKKVPVRIQQAISRLASKRGQTQAVWITQLVEKAEREQVGDLVSPELFDARQPALLPPTELVSPRLNLADLETLVRLGHETKGVRQNATYLLNDYISAARAAIRGKPSP